MPDVDLTARIAKLAALIEANLTEDEALATATISSDDRVRMRRGTPPPRWVEDDWGIRSEDKYGVLRVKHTWASERAHIVRHDPARVLRRVTATRDLVAVILAEQHADSERDSLRSCSQVLAPHLEGYSNRPCDCGRDARVARLLGIIASEWEG